MASQPSGKFVQSDYFDNTGGLNITDSPLKVSDTQATDGSNYDYTQTGAFKKRRGHGVINASADASFLKTRGIGMFVTTLNVKTPIKASDRVIRSINLDTGAFATLTDDTVSAATNVFPVSTSASTVFTQFNTASNSMLCFAGNTPGLYAAYSTTKYTKMGVAAPTGAITATTTSIGGAFVTSGTYWYSVVLRKASTQALSNAALDLSVSVTTTLQTNTIVLSALTGMDTTLYDQIWLYRSSVGGVTGFTTGDLIAQLASSATSYADTGTAVLNAQNVPRASSTVLDNSALPSGTYNVLTTWKRRVVTAKGNTLYISDLNKPESFPAVNVITLPSGGPVTALAVISFSTLFGNDEYLAVFKERELWLLKGNSYVDFSLSFVDAVGCPSQSLVTLANGFLAWIDYRGIYIWDGSGKPIYASRPIESLFAIDGLLDKPNLPYGWCAFYRKANQIIWYLSHKTYGIQKFAIKLDVRLSMPKVETTLSGRIMEGIFTFDSYTNKAIYAATSTLPSTNGDERLLLGDNAGYIYGGYESFADGTDAISFSYTTPCMNFGNTILDKRFNKVIVWVEELGSWNLSLDYWAGYRASLGSSSTLEQPMSQASQNAQALWDFGIWDTSYWDDYTPKLIGLTFNLNNDQGNSEGDCLRLRIRQSGASQPVTVYGYSVVWSPKGSTH